MRYSKEKTIITYLLWASVITTFIDISFAIYLAVMTNVATNYFSHYAKSYNERHYDG